MVGDSPERKEVLDLLLARGRADVLNVDNRHDYVCTFVLAKVSI